MELYHYLIEYDIFIKPAFSIKGIFQKLYTTYNILTKERLKLLSHAYECPMQTGSTTN